MTRTRTIWSLCACIGNYYLEEALKRTCSGWSQSEDIEAWKLVGNDTSVKFKCLLRKNCFFFKLVVDYTWKFSPVIRNTTLRYLLAYSFSYDKSWTIWKSKLCFWMFIYRKKSLEKKQIALILLVVLIEFLNWEVWNSPVELRIKVWNNVGYIMDIKNFRRSLAFIWRMLMNIKLLLQYLLMTTLYFQMTIMKLNSLNIFRSVSSNSNIGKWMLLTIKKKMVPVL